MYSLCDNVLHVHCCNVVNEMKIGVLALIT